MAIIKVDYENNSEWWGAARAQEWPDPVRQLFADDDEVEVGDLEARRFERLASTLPGWNDGPDYASYPVIVEYPHGVRVEVLDAVIALQEAGVPAYESQNIYGRSELCVEISGLAELVARLRGAR